MIDKSHIQFITWSWSLICNPNQFRSKIYQVTKGDSRVWFLVCQYFGNCCGVSGKTGLNFERSSRNLPFLELCVEGFIVGASCPWDVVSCQVAQRRVMKAEKPRSRKNYIQSFPNRSTSTKSYTWNSSVNVGTSILENINCICRRWCRHISILVLANLFPSALREKDLVLIGRK